MSVAPNAVDVRGNHNQHRALVRWVRACEGDMIADRAAVDALEKLAVLIEVAPLTSTARDLALNWLEEARSALLLHLWPMRPSP